MSVKSIPTRYARSLLNLVVEKRYDYLPMLAAAGIDFDPFKTSSPAYQTEISAMQYTQLSRQILSLVQDETFGLSAGKGVTPGAFRMMCYCLLSCENLGKAIRRACEFYRTFFPVDAQLVMTKEATGVAVGYANAIGGVDREVQATDAYSLSMWHRFFCWLTGRSVALTEIRFRGLAPSPERQEKYRELFQCPVRFAQPCDEMLIETRQLSSPLMHTENSLKEFLRTAPYQLMVINTESTASSLISRVKALIGHDFSQGFPSFEKITHSLNMSAPTLRRRLKAEGTTFQQLKDACRRDASQAYLANPDLSINAVAVLMGFTDPSAFHRSFKKWTGMTPGEYRQRELEHGAA